MDDSARTCADIINGEMQKALLRLFVSAYQSALVVEFGEVEGSSSPSEAFVGVINQPSSTRTLMLPEEPGVSPRPKMLAPSRQIASRVLISVEFILVG